ncbi:MAG: type II toxin-antitoxin system HipA family toxin [Caulobacteraceae bacterium]
MARRPHHAPLNVFLNSRRVGRLRREPSGAIDFTYDPDWLGWSPALPISLSLPLREERYAGEPVIAVFDNLLPDSDQIRRALAARVHAGGTDAYSLLGAIGRDCVGALQFLPVEHEPGPAGAVEAVPLQTAQISAMLGDLAQAPLGLTEDATFRISLAGAQEKTALLFQDGGWWVPAGTTATTHILKPQIGRLPGGIDFSRSVENEYLCMKLTQAVGLQAAKVEIADFEGRRALIVERFDRRWTAEGRLLRLPQEDMCQALSVPPAFKYEAHGGPGIEAVLRQLSGGDDPAKDQAAFLKAIVWYWLLGATDGHAKNFSIFLKPGGRYAMTPLYDVLSVQPAVDAGQVRHNQFKLSMAVGAKRNYVMASILPRHFVETAARANVGKPIVQQIFDGLSECAPSAIDTVKAGLPNDFPPDLLESVERGVQTRLKLLDQAKLDDMV